MQLAGVLAPGGAVAAAPTPLGRGLVAQQQIAQGATLLSGDHLWVQEFEAKLLQAAARLMGVFGVALARATPAGPCLRLSPWCSAVDWANLLCVTDEPAKGNAFGRRVLEDWQLLHGRLPPLLNRYLERTKRRGVHERGCRSTKLRTV